jgi:c-di-GMP-binding flagellar brake protein YcgR
MTQLPLSSSWDITEDGADERRWSRYHIDLPVKAMIRCQGEPKMVHGMASNLSLGGMAMQLPAELVVGERLEVLVTLPFCTQPLKLQMVVRNRRSYVYGVEFSSLSASQRAAIEQACRSLDLLQ